MSRQEQNALAGAGLGGVIGHEIGNDRDNDRRDDRYRNAGKDYRDNRDRSGRRHDVSDRSGRSNRGVGYGDGDWFGN